jgi:hypothetical protein
VKPEQAPKGKVVDADPTDIRGRPRTWREDRRSIARWSTGVVGAACVHGDVRNTGGLAERDCDPNTPSGRGASQESEGSTVPMKRVTTVEGRGPGSGCFTRNGRSGRLA